MFPNRCCPVALSKLKNVHDIIPVIILKQLYGWKYTRSHGFQQ